MRKRCLLGWMRMSGVAVTMFADLHDVREFTKMLTETSAGGGRR